MRENERERYKEGEKEIERKTERDSEKGREREEGIKRERYNYISSIIIVPCITWLV